MRSRWEVWRGFTFGECCGIGGARAGKRILEAGLRSDVFMRWGTRFRARPLFRGVHWGSFFVSFFISAGGKLVSHRLVKLISQNKAQESSQSAFDV